MWFVNAFRNHPELAIFLAMGLGFFIGRFSIKGIALGAVTGSLLAGVLVGQLKIEIPDLVKTVAFVAFLFALGYKVGPQFFAGLRKGGIPQVITAVIGCVVGLGVAYGMAKLMGYGAGWGAGLLSGGLTQSAAMGVATSAIQASTTIPADQKQTMIDQIPVGYAVCYLVGTAAAAYFLSQIAPRMMGTKDLPAEAAELEKKLGTFQAIDTAPAYRQVVRRTYKITAGSELDGTSVRDEEALAESRGRRIFLQRFRRGDEVSFTTPDTVLHAGDVVTVTANRNDFVKGRMEAVGEEVDDPDLLSYDIETLAVVITNKGLHGKTLNDLAQDDLARNLFVRKVIRAGIPIPFGSNTELHRGDEITIEGPKELVEKAVAKVGRPNRTSDETDYSYVGAGIVLGGLIGIPTIALAGADIGLTTSGGALIMGLIFGWLRSKSPTFGNFPPAAEWLMSTGGLCMFVAIVGIQSGPNFIAGVKSEGLSLVLAGLVVTLVPMFVTLAIGKYVFKWRSVLNVGATAGSFTTTASIGAINTAAKSQIATLYYTVPYAIANVLLTIWGSVIVALLS